MKKNIPRGYGYHEKSRETQYGERSPYGKTYTVPAPSAPKSAPAAASFSVGDRVQHRAFGGGVLTKMTPMGGDYLIEVQFERVGTKKLMLRAAAQQMTKE